MIKLGINWIVVISTIYYVESCKIPQIQNGHLINSENGETLPVGSYYDDYYGVSVKWDSGYSILTIRPGDNNVLCLPDGLTWIQKFKECQSMH